MTVVDNFKQGVLRGFDKAGYTLRKNSPLFPFERRLRVIMAHLGIDTVLDVGANAGQYAQKLRQAGYSGKIISFEPLSAAHAELVEAAKGDMNWIVAERMAISDRNDQGQINISQNSVSSSLNAMLPAHEQSAPQSKYLGQEEVKLQTIEEAGKEYLEGSEKIFLKIDTQGHEMAVLRGAESMSNIRAVQIELSFVPLYEGQKLWPEVSKYLEEQGYELWALWPGFSDKETGRMLQADGVFIKK